MTVSVFSDSITVANVTRTLENEVAILVYAYESIFSSTFSQARDLQYKSLQILEQVLVMTLNFPKTSQFLMYKTFTNFETVQKRQVPKVKQNTMCLRRCLNFPITFSCFEYSILNFSYLLAKFK